MPSLTDVFVAILPDTTQFGRQLTTQLRRIDASNDGKHVGGTFTSGFTGALKGIGVGLAGAFAAVGVGSLFKDTISAASDLGESVNAVNVVFGKAAGGVLALGDNAAKSVGLSKTEFNGLAVQFSNFATTVAGAGGDVTGVLGDLTGRAADFASVMNLDVSEAAEVFQSALSGETEPIKKFGIDMSAAAVEAYAMANGIGTAGKALTESEKVQARYALLMEKTSVTTGDFANTSDSLANRQRILAATVDNLKAKVGGALLPAMTAAFGFVLEKAIPAVEGLIAGFSGGEGAAGRFAGVFERIKATVGPVLVEIQGGVRALVEAFRSGGEEVTRSGFAGGMQQIGIFARDAFDYIKSDVIPAALAVGRALRELGQGALPIAVAAFKSLFDSLTGVFNFVKANDTVFSSLAAGLVAGYVAFRIFTVVTNAFKAAQVAAMVVTTAYKAVLQAYALWTYTATGSTTAFAFAMNVLKVAFLTNPIGIVVIGLVALGAALFVAYKKSETFRDIVNSVWAAIKGSVGGVVDWFTGTVLPALSGVWRGISSKALELRDTLSAAWRGISAGFGAVLGAFGAVYDTVIAPVFAAFKADAKALWTGLQVVWDGIKAGFAMALRGFGAVYDAVVAPVFAAFLAGARALGVGVRVAWDGLRSAFAVAMSGFGAVYNTVVVPVFAAFKAGALGLWTGVQVVWDGIRAGFSAAMTGFRAVYQTLIAPVFVLFRVAAEALWASVGVVWEGIRAGFDLSMRGIQAVYRGAMVPIFEAYKAAAVVLWRAAEAAWEGIRAAFDLSMKAVRAVYDSVIAPLFKAYSAAAQVLWDGVRAIWEGMRASFDAASRGIRAVYDNVIVPVFDAFKDAADKLWFAARVIWEAMKREWDLVMRGIKAVYDSVIVPLFNAFKSAADTLWFALRVIWEAMRREFDLVMRGLKAVYDNVLKPLWDTFATGVRGLKAIFDTVVDGIGRTWDTLKDKMRAPIKIAFDWVNANVIDKVRGVISAITGGSVNLPDLPHLAKGGPVEGPGGPRDDKVLMWGSAGEFMVNAKAAKKHRGLLEGINAGRKPERLPGDEFGGPVGDVWGTITGAADAIKGFAADMLTKGARKAAEFLLNPIKDRLFSLIGSGNVVSAVLRGGLEKLFAAVLSKGDEKDKEMAAAKKAGGIGAFPGGGTGTGLVAFARLMQSMGARASEHPLFGGVNPVHTRGSNHYIGRAVDLNYGPGGQNATEMAFFDQVVARGLPRQYGLRYIWRAPGHFNHMHVDYDKGGYLQPGAMGVNRGTRPERVLTPAQTDSFDRLVKVLERGQPATAGASSFNFNVYNPVAEPTSVTTNKALQRAADLALV